MYHTGATWVNLLRKVFAVSYPLLFLQHYLQLS